LGTLSPNLNQANENKENEKERKVLFFEGSFIEKKGFFGGELLPALFTECEGE